MDSRQTETPIIGRKFVRRSLTSGLAALGAAAILKVTGGSRAEAVDGGNIVIGDETQTASSQTRLTTSHSAGPGFQVVSFGGAPVGINSALTGSCGVEFGVLGRTTGTATSGVWGIAASPGSGFGVKGQSVGGTGVYGLAASPTGSGVRALSSNNGTGVLGISNTGGSESTDANGSGKGVHGKSSSGDGVHGASITGVGLRGTSPTFVGVVGISDLSIGLYGFTAAANVPALYAENLAPSGRIAGVFHGDVQVFGNFTVMPGFAKNAAVTMPDGSDAVLYCQESPEPYFEDFGRAQLVNGQARVPLEPEFASIIKRDDYMVFVTPNGEVKNPLFVSSQNGTSFEVREANGGRGDLLFTYRIVARRRDIAGKRLERVDPRTKANIANMRAQSAQKSGGARPQALASGETPLVPMEPLPPAAAQPGPGLAVR